MRSNPAGDPFELKHPKTISEAKIMGLGIGLYWGEGNKKNKTSVRIGNSDPGIINSFIRFLVDIFNVDPARLRFSLQVYDDLNSEDVLKGWLLKMEEFGIKRSQFFKTTRTRRRGIGTYRQKNKFGVLTLYLFNSKLKRILDSYCRCSSDGRARPW